MTTEKEKKPIPAWIIRFMGVVATIAIIWAYSNYKHIKKPYYYVITTVVNSMPEYSYYEGYYTKSPKDTILLFYNLPLQGRDIGGYGIGDTIQLDFTYEEYSDRIKK